jgi:hypothetical protein
MNKKRRNFNEIKRTMKRMINEVKEDMYKPLNKKGFK